MAIVAGLVSLIAGGLLLAYAINGQLLLNRSGTFTETRAKMLFAVIGVHFDDHTLGNDSTFQNFVTLTFVVAGVVLLLSILLMTVRQFWVQGLLILVNLAVTIQYVAGAIVFHDRNNDIDEDVLTWLYVGLGVFALATVLTMAAGVAMKRRTA